MKKKVAKKKECPILKVELIGFSHPKVWYNTFENFDVMIFTVQYDPKERSYKLLNQPLWIDEKDCKIIGEME